MSLTRRGFAWAVVALLGIALAAALTWSATKLAAQRIGLSSEPLSVINGLAPTRARRPTRPKIAGSQGDGEPSRATSSANGTPTSGPAPPVGTSSAPSGALPAGALPASPSFPPSPPSPVAATGPPATAALPTNSSPAPTPQPSSPAVATATATRSANSGDHPDDSSAGPHGGSNRGHSGRDD